MEIDVSNLNPAEQIAGTIYLTRATEKKTLSINVYKTNVKIESCTV